MSKCENCIHEEACDQAKYDDYFGECKLYKDKSLFVELPCRCEECVYFQCDNIRLEDGTYRDYTEEEIKNGKCVTLDVGINVGSRCLRFHNWERNSIPVWFQEKDYCSYGKRKLREVGE